ncbi:MAG: cobalt transporter [Leifsonia xyli]|nr:MAG: cobalt transporter [Leifsonia xyli]
MLRLILTVGLVAGFAAGLAMTILQQFTTSPIIAAAEVYEQSADTVRKAQVTEPASHGHDDEGWQPTDGLQRIGATTVATVGAAVGYALLIVSLMLIAGVEITPTSALCWALGGFAATGLATAFGLAPELPGSAAADLVSRQLWSAATALSTAAGLYGLIYLAAIPWRLGGAALIVLPHLIGAPRTASFEATAPAELGAQFAATSLALQGLLWAAVGIAVGFAWRRLASPAQPAR